MVIGPRDLEKKIETQEADKVRLLEEKIDGKLVERYQGTDEFWILVNSDELPRKMILNQMMKKYESQGWVKAEYKKDPHTDPLNMMYGEFIHLVKGGKQQ